jgi:hypothetical protein
LNGPQVERLPPIEQPPLDDVEPTAPALEELPSSEELLAGEADWWFVPASWYQPWDGSAELGLNGTEGNSQTFNIRAGAKAKHSNADSWAEQTYELVHVDNSSNGVKTALNGYFDGRISRPLAQGQPWSAFAHMRVEYDEFRDYDLRVSGDAGLAYDFWQIDRPPGERTSKLQLRSGLSSSREIGGSDNHFVPELTFGLDFSHKIDDRQKISLVSDYYPSVEDVLGDYRINTTASYEIIVSQAWGLSAKLSVIDRYDNTPQSRRPNDINYAALMLWAF